MSALIIASLPGHAGTELKPIGLVTGPGGDFRSPGIKLPRRSAQPPVLPRPNPYEVSGYCEGEVDERFRAVAFELQPRTVLGTYFARRMAVGMVRADRGVRHGEAMLAFRRRHAAEAFDRARQEAAQAALRRLDGDDPRAARLARQELLAMPEGVDLLSERLLTLRAQAGRDEPVWSLAHEESLRIACGWRDDEMTPTRAWTLTRALMGDARLLRADDRVAATSAPRFSTWVGHALAGELASEVDRLRHHRDSLDHETIGRDRLEATERAEFDPGRAETLARRFEAQAAREVRQSLDALIAIEAAAEAATLAPEAPALAEAPETNREIAPPPGSTTTDQAAERIEASATFGANSGYVIDLTAILASFGSGQSRSRRVGPAGPVVPTPNLEPGRN